MPPIPETYDDEATRIIESARRHQSDISNFQLPRLRTCAGPLSLQQKLSGELREDIETLSREVQGLEMLVDDQSSPKARRDLSAIVSEFQESLAKLKQEARGALLTSKRLIDSQAMSNRDELLRSNGASTSEKRDPNEKMEDKLMKANNDVTDALRRTMTLMQGELERSVLTTQMLDASSASLRTTSTTHDTLTNLMGTSKHLITALEKADWIDRLLILSALAFFILVVLFIVKVRILDRGLRIAFWWTRFLPSGGAPQVSPDVLGQAEKGGLTDVLTSILIPSSTLVASSVAASVATTLSASAISTTSPEAPEEPNPPIHTPDHIEL
ncbi:hypothetical protein ONZ45_g14794 [Pleurotus djamor]|nr:hypothetical protein ONZ45_g14794 [Pleurotus djamor]